MPGKVVDASVLAAIAFGEPRFAEALSLLEGTELYAPGLLAYELTNVARKKALLYPSMLQELAASLENALFADIQWAEVDHSEVLALALETGLTAYDASYLYVSRLLDLPLVTFDEKLQQASAETGRRPDSSNL